MPPVRRPAILDTAFSLAGSLLSLVLSFVMNVLVARSAGPAGKGVLVLVTVLILTIGGWLALGVEEALVHFGGRNPEQRRELSADALRLLLVVGPIGAGIGMLGVAFVFSARLHGVFASALISMLAVPLTIAAAYTHGLLRASGRIVEAAVQVAFGALAKLGAIALAIAWGWGVDGMLKAMAFAFFLAALAGAVNIYRIGLFPAFSLRRERSGLLRYGLRGHVGTVLQSLNYRLDLFIVAIFLSNREVGLYSVSAAVAGMLWLLPQGLGFVLLQRVASSGAEQANRATGLATRITSTLLLVASVPLAVGGGRLITLMFGHAFEASVAPMRLLLPGIWALGIWKTLTNDFVGRGHAEYKSYTAGAGVVVTIVLDILLIPRMGINGAAIASSAAYSVASFTAIVAYVRLTGVTYRDLLLPKSGDLAAVRASITALRTYVKTSLRPEFDVDLV